MTGTVLSQTISFAMYPILTRIYTPQDFALFGLYTALVGILATIATLRYELAVPIPQKVDEANMVITVAILCSAFISILSFVFLMIFKSELSTLLNNTAIENWLIVIPIAVFLIGTYHSFNYRLIRLKAFKASAINKVSQKLAEAPTSMSLGLTSFSQGLIVADLIGRFVIAFISAMQSTMRGFALSISNLRNIRMIAAKYSHLALYNCLPALADATALYLPILFISSFYNEETTGHFNAARLLLSIPIMFVSLNLSQVLLPRILDRVEARVLVFPDIASALRYLLIAAVAFIIILVLISPQLFALALGSTWKTSGHYASIMVTAFGLRFVATSLSTTFVALQSIRWLSHWQIFFLVSIASMAFLRPLHLQIETFLLIITTIESICYGIYILLILSVAHLHDKRNKRSECYT